jgi:hypothetical protein
MQGGPMGAGNGVANDPFQLEMGDMKANVTDNSQLA